MWSVCSVTPASGMRCYETTVWLRAQRTLYLDCILRFVSSMCSDVWPPSSWSAYQHPVRTNNDVEGWHYRLNCRARDSHLAFYVLICLLWEEDQACNIKLVSDRKLSRRQKRSIRIFMLVCTTCGQISILVPSLLDNCSLHTCLFTDQYSLG